MDLRDGQCYRHILLNAYTTSSQFLPAEIPVFNHEAPLYIMLGVWYVVNAIKITEPIF